MFYMPYSLPSTWEGVGADGEKGFLMVAFSRLPTLP